MVLLWKESKHISAQVLKPGLSPPSNPDLTTRLHKSFPLCCWHSAHIAYRGCKFSFKWRSLLEGRCTFSVNFYRKTSSWWSCHHWWEITTLWWQTTEGVKWEQSQGKTWKERQVLYIWHHAFDLMSLLTSFCFKVLVWFTGMTLQFQVGSVTEQCWSKHRKVVGAGYSVSLVFVKAQSSLSCLSALHLLTISSLQFTQMGILDF